VRVVLQVSLVEVIETRMRAMNPPADRSPDEEDRGRHAVVRAEAAVLLDAAAELAEDDEDHAVRHAERLQVPVERLDRIGDDAEEQRVCVLLLRVRVESSLREVVDARAEAAAHELAHPLEAVREMALRVLHGHGSVAQAHDPLELAERTLS